jgi:sirohydrochlorin cobaltochelatase
LAEISAPRIFIAPLFISEGYFAEDVIPRELGFSGHAPLVSGQSSIFYCLPVGTHDSMTGVILARAKEVVEKFPFPRVPKPAETTLFIAGHGTVRNPGSRRTMERQAELIRALNIYAGVQAVFLEENPRIGDCYALAQTRNIVIVPFFISDGLHTQEDIPLLLGETQKNIRQRLASGQPTWRNPSEHKAKRVWYAPAVGSEPHLADVILERVREAAG